MHIRIHYPRNFVAPTRSRAQFLSGFNGFIWKLSLLIISGIIGGTIAWYTDNNRIGDTPISKYTSLNASDRSNGEAPQPGLQDNHIR